MKHISDALGVVHEDCAWFARAREVRLLVVRTSSDLRSTLTKLIPGYEFHADNRSPWVLLEDPYELLAPLWESRAARLLQDWEQRRDAFAQEDIHLPPPTPRYRTVPPDARNVTPIDLFLRVCDAVTGALQPPLDGLVLILAPTIVDDAAALDTDLSFLFTRPELDTCRIVLVLDEDIELPRRTIEHLAELCIVCSAVTNPEQKGRDLQALVNTQGAGAHPAGVVPPRRPNAPPDLDPEVRNAALREAGIEPAYLEHAPALRQLILGAALAMGEGRTADGIRIQTEAVSLSEAVGMPQMTVICQMTLASYMAAGGERLRALEVLDVAASRADQHELRDQQSQAYLAQGLLYTLERRHLDAAHAYYRCAQLAESVHADILAIEAWRLAGQAALEGGAAESGVQYFMHALDEAGQLDASVRSNTSAPEVARRLAKVYEDWGYATHAQSLYAQADLIEQGLPAEPVGT